MKRQQRIKTLLMSVGADPTNDVVATVEIFLEFIPDQYLKHFTEYVLKNYDKYKKPIVNITTASQEYKKRLKLAMIKRGEDTIETVQDTKDFLLDYFKGQKIANNIDGLYLPLVTVSLDENGAFMNDYTNKKLNSEDEADFISWCFSHQDKIGVVEIIETHRVKQMLLEQREKIEQLDKQEVEPPTNPKMLDFSQKFIRRF